MSLRQNLTKPLIMGPTDDHTHTVIFLHRFPAETTEEELREKVLAQKLTKNHKTLHEQFPGVRWVFPHPKAHARHWSGLSAEDKAEIGLDKSGLPYITQIILQESKRAGGLDKIMLGGQGETAEAAHESMSTFPEASRAQRDVPEAMTGFIKQHFHQTWTDVSQLKLGGFVGMHAQGGQVTRDAKNFGITSKLPGPKSINTTIVTNTPHKFIQGGYKVQTTTWDGKRIDDFASFLEDLGVYRIRDSTVTIDGGNGVELLTLKDRSGSKKDDAKKADAREQLNDVQKHALQVLKDKKATEETRNKILQRIEADKVERKIRQERQRQARLARQGKLEAENQLEFAPGNSQPAHDTTEYSSVSLVIPNAATSPDAEERLGDFDDAADDDDLLAQFSRHNAARNAQILTQGDQRAGGNTEWSSHGQVRGEMSASQMRALGLTNDQDVNVKGTHHIKED
ncbi:hypothetical protein VPNG_09413 [Cytospora leucostoma]|uniref:Uncharacterized protein n=1 Tax=Cytospora leucostoma TaxID=1230097 RepID=A0A423VPS9_9PEZI|nr:hypothetical protein VPNG_09413 [Cytospora leucostoma]